MHRSLAGGTSGIKRAEAPRSRALFEGENFRRRHADEEETHTPVDAPRMIDRIAQHAAAATEVAGNPPPALDAPTLRVSREKKRCLVIGRIFSRRIRSRRFLRVGETYETRGTMHDVVVATRRRCVATELLAGGVVAGTNWILLGSWR